MKQRKKNIMPGVLMVLCVLFVALVVVKLARGAQGREPLPEALPSSVPSASSTTAVTTTEFVAADLTDRFYAGIGIETLRIAEVQAFLEAHPSKTGYSYSETPDISAYAMGSLDEETRESILNFLNCMRYIAGVPANVAWDEAKTEMAQTAAYVQSRVRLLSHTPAQPDGMPGAVYKLGYEGSKSSNLAGPFLIDPLNTSLFRFLGDSDI